MTPRSLGTPRSSSMSHDITISSRLRSARVPVSASPDTATEEAATLQNILCTPQEMMQNLNERDCMQNLILNHMRKRYSLR
jgi:hypothetical protein